MLTKGTEDYKKASELANKISMYANTNRWSNNSFFTIAFEGLGRLVMEVQKVGGFASQVAETIDKTMDPYGKQVAFCSSKQAWILACAAIENNLSIEL